MTSVVQQVDNTKGRDMNYMPWLYFYHQKLYSSDKKINDKFFIGQSWLSVFYKNWHSINLSYSRTYTRDVFKTQFNVYNKAFLWFLQRFHIVDVLLGSKYPSVYIYVRLNPIENILHITLSILNIFAVKYIFLTKEEWNKVAISELKLLSLHFKFNCIHFVWFIPSDALNVKPNANTLPRGGKKR